MTDLLRLMFVLLCHYRHRWFGQATIFQCQSTDPCGCSRNHVDIHPPPSGGETAASRSWGWAVSVRDSSDLHICGGTILSKRFVLTAAHCFRKKTEQWPSYSVAVGVDSLLSRTGQIRSVSHILLHPNWNSTGKENDIAILRLNASIVMSDPNIHRICLPEITRGRPIRYPAVSSSLVAIGWGTIAWENLFLPLHLRQVALDVISDQEFKCRTMITDSNLQFCATVRGGEKGQFVDQSSARRCFTLDTCQGDSGGPIMQFSQDKRRWILAGIISYGDQCALRDYVGVYTRISVYIDWIKSVVGNDGLVIVEENSSPPRHPCQIGILLVVIILYLH